MLIFEARRLLSQKSGQMCLPKASFSRFSRKILLFLKKIVDQKNIQLLICAKKNVIFIFGVKWPLTEATSIDCGPNKVRFEGTNPSFYGPKYSPSNAFPASRFFDFPISMERINGSKYNFYNKTVLKLQIDWRNSARLGKNYLFYGSAYHEI